MGEEEPSFGMTGKRGADGEVIATGAVDETRVEAARYAHRALHGLGSLPRGAARRALETVVETALSRSY